MAFRRRVTITIDLAAVAAVLLGLLGGVITWAVLPHPLTLARLQRELGPKRYSEENEELLIRHFFHDRRYGVFVDVGSGDYQQGSNTYFLEKELGWRGIAIDANASYGPDYAKYRPATKFFPFFVSDRSDQMADFFLAPGDLTRSSGVPEAAAAVPRVVTERVRTITLNDLLGQNSITRFDFLSMDIELGEPVALRGLTIERFRPALVCVEAHAPVRDQLIAYFRDHHYRRLEDFDRVDPRNWYFTPQ
jgi:hypothetical protein